VEHAVLLGPTADIRSFGRAMADAEALGYTAVWIPDQAFHRDPFVALAVAASHTSRIHLGLGVTNPYTRHPAMIARAAATLAELTDGRFILGLGAGERSLKDRVGAPRAPFVPTIRATVTALREVFDGRTSTVDAASFRMAGVRLDFVPRQPVPIYLATRKLEGLRLAGAIADGVILGDYCDPEPVALSIAHIHVGAQEAGREPSQIAIVSWIIAIVTDDPRTARDRLRPIIAKTIDNMLPEAVELARIKPEALTALRATRSSDRDGVPASIVPDWLVDRLTIIGDAATCVDRMRALRDAGATQIAVRMPVDLARTFDVAANIRVLAREVFPKLAAGVTP
jgi:5,10-methylenetetrahydromethanopterin reductase